MWPSRADVTQLEPGGAANQAASMWQTLRLPVAWLSMLLFIVYTGIELGIGQWAFPLLVEARGMGTVEAGAAVGAYWAGLTLGRLFFGTVIAAIGVERLLRICLLSVLLGLGVLWLPVPSGVAFAVLALLGAAQAPVFPLVVCHAGPFRLGAYRQRGRLPGCRVGRRRQRSAGAAGLSGAGVRARSYRPDTGGRGSRADRVLPGLVEKSPQLRSTAYAWRRERSDHPP